MKRELKAINGILLLDKPLHMTSNGALQRVKRLFSAKKAGHTGSLDPLATGMLPLCFGEATKVSQFLLDSDKHYSVEVKLGMKTTTGDAEGEVIQTLPVPTLSTSDMESILAQFLGEIDQVPPMFSALKHQGKPLYELARKGIEVERKSRKVTIHSIKLTSFNVDTFTMDVHCTKGTYIRTLAEDIGDKIGCGAFVSGLRRTSVEPYQHNKMITMEELEDMVQQQDGAAAFQALLLPMDTSLQNLPEVKLSSSTTFYLRSGQSVMVPNLPTSGFVRIFSDNSQFMGIGEILEDGRLAPRRLVNLS